MRATIRGLLRRHGSVVMAGLGFVVLLRRRRGMMRRRPRVGHDTRHHGCLQPGRAKQREHDP